MMKWCYPPMISPRLEDARAGVFESTASGKNLVVAL